MSILVYVLAVVVIAGLIAFLLRSAPFIDEPFKSIGVWVILAVAVILVVIKLSGMVGF